MRHFSFRTREETIEIPETDFNFFANIDWSNISESLLDSKHSGVEML